MALHPYAFGEMPRSMMPFETLGGLEEMFAPAMFRGLQPMAPMAPGYVRPWRFTSGPESGVSKIINNKDKFEVSLDVKMFKPEEITVRHADNVVTVEGKHEEKEDEHGYVTRHFVRRYVMPKEVEVEKCKVQLSSDGVLNFSVPKKPLPDKSAGRTLPIQKTGAPAVKAAETKK